jgi:predicted phosphodiesterase
MKILIISDSHDAWAKIEKAIAIGNENNCQVLLHAGDFVTPAGVKLLAKFKGEVHIVWGNNEGEREG